MTADPTATRIPSYNEMLWETVQAIRDLGGSGHVEEITERTIELGGFSEAQQAELMPNGRTPKLRYKVHWCLSTLKAVGMLENSARGVWSLTDAGRRLTEDDIADVRKRITDHYREIARERRRRRRDIAPRMRETTVRQRTPAARPRTGGTACSGACGRWTLQRSSGSASDSSEADFEKVQVTGRAGAQGIDGVGLVRLGLLSFPTYFQCKRYSDTVGAGAVRDFRGAMAGRGKKDVLITTGTFTPAAQHPATRDGVTPIDLVDGDELCELLATASASTSPNVSSRTSPSPITLRSQTMRFLGIDLAWAEADQPNESGVVALDPDGSIVDAGWTRLPSETMAWIDEHATDDCLLFVDAPLVVPNPPRTMRLCERQVGQRYGRWKVSANSTNQGTPRRVGERLRERLEDAGWIYDDGADGPQTTGRRVSECYPYTTLVGAPELGNDHERPAYKRKPRAMPGAVWPSARAAACDTIIRSLAALQDADPPLQLRSHRETAQLVDTPSPQANAAYKHREDLIDACLCAWTAALWHRHGLTRCQVLGVDDALRDAGGRRATIITPARPEQRRSAPAVIALATSG